MMMMNDDESRVWPGGISPPPPEIKDSPPEDFVRFPYIMRFLSTSEIVTYFQTVLSPLKRQAPDIMFLLTFS
jgi:hypothetical protein